MKRIDNNQSIIKDNYFLIFLYLVISHYIFFQIIGVLRSAFIYDTLVIMNYSYLLISLSLLLIGIFKIKSFRFTISEIILTIVPIAFFTYGLIVNGGNRDLFADTYNSLFAVFLLVYSRNTTFKLNMDLQKKIANLMFWGLLISEILYTLFPLIGIPIISVGTVEIYFLFPLMFFLVNKMHLKTVLTIILLVLGGKRGVLLGAFISLFVFTVKNTQINKYLKSALVSILVVFAFGVIDISMTPNNIINLPTQLQPFFTKIMHVNPFSDYNRIEQDYRVSEAKSSITPMKESPTYIVLGKGPGYLYTVYDNAGNIRAENVHNSHFSPTSIYSKYGIIYFVVLYGLIIIALAKNIKRLKRRNLVEENKILLLYAMASFIYSFTAFSIYSDYIFIISLGILRRVEKR